MQLNKTKSNWKWQKNKRKKIGSFKSNKKNFLRKKIAKNVWIMLEILIKLFWKLWRIIISQK